MHVPIGRSGVQAVPKTLHSHGLITPLSTSPHWQAFGSATRDARQREAPLGVELGVGVAEPQRALRDDAEPAPLEVRAQLHRLGDRPRAPAGCPRGRTTRTYWFSTSQRPSASWRRIIAIDWSMSSGSNPDTTTGLPYSSAMNRYGLRADHRRDVPGPDEAVEPQVGRLEDRPQRRHDRDVVAEDREVLDAERTRPLQRDRGRGRGGLEADREEARRAGRARGVRARARRAASRPCARRHRVASPRAASRGHPGRASCRRRW